MAVDAGQRRRGRFIEYGDGAFEEAIGSFRRGHVLGRACQECSPMPSRPQITRDMWEAMNSTWLAYEAIDPKEITAAKLPELLDWIRQRTALFRGALLGTILRDDGY